MATTARGTHFITGEALRLFAEGYAPIAIEHLHSGLGPDWAIKLGFESTRGLGKSHVRTITDPAQLLELLKDAGFDEILMPVGGDRGRLRRAAIELDALRDRWAHAMPLGQSDALAAVGHALTLTRAYDLDETELVQLEVEAAALVSAGRPARAGRADYLDALDRRLRRLDLGGISPAVDATVVKGDLASVFVNPRITVKTKTRSGAPRHAAFADQSDVGLDELLGRQRLMLLGPPGAGKSTVLRVAAHRMAFDGTSRPGALPILVRAADYGHGIADTAGLSFLRFVTQHHSERFGPLFADAIEDGSAVVLVDGLDEVADDATRLEVAARLLDFAADYPDIGVWASSRPFGYRPGRFAGSFEEARIEPLDEPRIRELVGRWDAMTRGDDELESHATEALVADIQANRGLRDLATNPLLLTILYLLALRGGRLPSRKVEVYAIATDTLLRDWPAHRLQQRFDPADFREVLERVALWMQQQASSTIAAPRVTVFLAEHFETHDGLAHEVALGRARDVLRLVEEHTGIFVEVGRVGDERRYGFIHRTFAEYLAARALAEVWEREGLDWDPILFDDSMQETVELLVGHVASGGRARATRILRKMRDRSHPAELLTHRDLRLVLDALAAGAQVDPAFRDEVVGAAVERLIRVSPPQGDVGTCVSAMGLVRTLGRAARAGSVGAIDRRLAPVTGDDADLARRKTLVWASLEPGDAARISKLAPMLCEGPLGSLDAVLAGSILDHAASPRPEGASTPLFVTVLGKVLDEDAGTTLVDAGWPHATPGEIADHRHAGTLSTARILDLRDWDPSVNEFVAIASAWPPPFELRAIVPPAEWHVVHASEIRALADQAPELHYNIATTAAWLADETGAIGFWAEPLRALALHGSREARQVALDAYTERDGPDFAEVGAAALDDPDPAIRYRVLQPNWEPGYLEANSDWMVPAARQLLAVEQVDWVRGGALRTLLHLETDAGPFSLLAEPAAYAFPPSEIEASEPSLEAAMVRLARAASEFRGNEADPLIEAATRLVEGAPRMLEPLGVEFDDPPTAYEAIGTRCLGSSRAVARMSGMTLLGALDDMPDRSGPIVGLLSDPDDAIRERVVTMIDGRDVGDESDLWDMTLAVLEHGPPEAAHTFMVAVKDYTDEDRILSLVALLDAFIETHPTSDTAAMAMLGLGF